MCFRSACFFPGMLLASDSSMFLILGNILALRVLPIIPAPAQRSQGRTLSVGSASRVLHLGDTERAARPPSGCLWVREVQARGQALKYKSSERHPTHSEVLGLHSLPYTGKEAGDNLGCLPGPKSTAAAACLPEPGLEGMGPCTSGAPSMGLGLWTHLHWTLSCDQQPGSPIGHLCPSGTQKGAPSSTQLVAQNSDRNPNVVRKIPSGNETPPVPGSPLGKGFFRPHLPPHTTTVPKGHTTVSEPRAKRSAALHEDRGPSLEPRGSFTHAHTCVLLCGDISDHEDAVCPHSTMYLTQGATMGGSWVPTISPGDTERSWRGM